MSTTTAAQFEVIPPSAIEQVTRAEVDIQISTAKRYPRTLSKVKADMLSFATLDQETAEACFYSLPRGGKNIQGPSVRLAEIAVSCYGNLRAGSRIIEVVTTGDAPHVVIQAVCHDLEKNTAVQIEKRRRITKKKNKDTIDEDDINLAANAGSAIAFRDAVFKIIPGALIKPVFEGAKALAIGDARSLSERRERGIAAFGKMGVTPERVLAMLGKRAVDDIDLTDIETMIGLHTAIKDGNTTIDEAFPPVGAATSPDKPNFLKKEQPAAKSDGPTFEESPPQQPAPTTTTSEAPAETLPIEDDSAERASLLLKIEEACNADSVDRKKLRAWAYRNKLCASDKLALPSYPTESLRQILARWDEVKA